MPELEPEMKVTRRPGELNDSQQRRLRVTCQYIDKLLSEIEHVLHSASSQSPFPRYVSDLTPARARVIEDHTPVIFASRSPHMEDIGTLRPLCADKSERLELKNWPPQIALEFARRSAERSQLWASNLEAVLPSFVEWSDGNPGSILHMLKMAHLPQYRVGEQIKAHILYVDYRMGRR